MKKECEPIFIVGSARTGTSAVVGALRLGAGIAGYNEGHYLSMMPAMAKLMIEHVMERRKLDPSGEVMMAHIKADDVIDDLMGMMKARMEAQFPGNEVWFDKTPDVPMIRAIPYIIKMWPKARFIFTKRRAIENVSSRLRKFKHLTFERNCEHWATSMVTWTKMKVNIPESQRIEIDQREMGLEPMATAERIGRFLGFSENQTKDMGKILKDERYEFTGGNEREVKALSELGWNKEQLEAYEKICVPVNKEFGYSEDSSYYIHR